MLADPPPAFRARSLVALGAALPRAGPARFREPLSAGLELADDCGAAPLAEEADDELAARRRPGPRPPPLADALTASEHRICRMAAAGMSNPPIAQSLFVTRATVESHLHSTYRKLGIASRAHLAEALRVYD